MKQKKPKPSVVVNRRAHYDYQLGDSLTVGMALTGPQVRAIRDLHAGLRGTFVSVKNGELWLNNLTLGPEPTPNIKLLATRHQIAQLSAEKITGLTIVPTKLLPAGRHIKLVIALGRGKKRYDKREVIKKRDQARDTSS